MKIALAGRRRRCLAKPVNYTRGSVLKLVASKQDERRKFIQGLNSSKEPGD